MHKNIFKDHPIPWTTKYELIGDSYGYALYDANNECIASTYFGYEIFEFISDIHEFFQKNKDVLLRFQESYPKIERARSARKKNA